MLVFSNNPLVAPACNDFWVAIKPLIGLQLRNRTGIILATFAMFVKGLSESSISRNHPVEDNIHIADLKFIPKTKKNYIPALFYISSVCLKENVFYSRTIDSLDNMTIFTYCFEAVYCYMCGHRRVAVARYRMICLVLP